MRPRAAQSGRVIVSGLPASRGRRAPAPPARPRAPAALGAAGAAASRSRRNRRKAPASWPTCSSRCPPGEGEETGGQQGDEENRSSASFPPIANAAQRLERAQASGIEHEAGRDLVGGLFLVRVRDQPHGRGRELVGDGGGRCRRGRAERPDSSDRPSPSDEARDDSDRVTSARAARRRARPSACRRRGPRAPRGIRDRHPARGRAANGRSASRCCSHADAGGVVARRGAVALAPQLFDEPEQPQRMAVVGLDDLRAEGLGQAVGQDAGGRRRGVRPGLEAVGGRDGRPDQDEGAALAKGAGLLEDEADRKQRHVRAGAGRRSRRRGACAPCRCAALEHGLGLRAAFGKMTIAPPAERAAVVAAKSVRVAGGMASLPASWRRCTGSAADQAQERADQRMAEERRVGERAQRVAGSRPAGASRPRSSCGGWRRRSAAPSAGTCSAPTTSTRS